MIGNRGRLIATLTLCGWEPRRPSDMHSHFRIIARFDGQLADVVWIKAGNGGVSGARRQTSVTGWPPTTWDRFTIAELNQLLAFVTKAGDPS